MLITFKSDAHSDVIMFGNVAQHMLRILGKDPLDARGIVTVAQLPGAIASLQAAIEADRETARRRTQGGEGSTQAAEPMISTATRAVPLLTLLQHAEHAGAAVTWEST